MSRHLLAVTLLASALSSGCSGPAAPDGGPTTSARSTAANSGSSGSSGSTISSSLAGPLAFPFNSEASSPGQDFADGGSDLGAIGIVLVEFKGGARPNSGQEVLQGLPSGCPTLQGYRWALYYEHNLIIELATNPLVSGGPVVAAGTYPVGPADAGLWSTVFLLDEDEDFVATAASGLVTLLSTGATYEGSFSVLMQSAADGGLLPLSGSFSAPFCNTLVGGPGNVPAGAACGQDSDCASGLECAPLFEPPDAGVCTVDNMACSQACTSSGDCASLSSSAYPNWSCTGLCLFGGAAKGVCNPAP